MAEMADGSIKLSAARTLAGMTQDEAAKKLGMTKYTLSRYENYKMIVPLDVAGNMVNLYRIPARLIDFGCDTRFLLGG